MKLALANLCVFALAAIRTASAAEKPQVQLRGAISLEGDNHADFFPKSAESEMAEESGDGSKKSSSQKRQEKRDARRSINNPDRTQDEERAERERQTKKARNTGNRCRDPSEPGCGDDNHPRDRDAQRRSNCENNGRQCEYHRVSPQHEPNSNRRNRDYDCIESCQDEYDGDDDYVDKDINDCVKRECTGTKWSFNGAATYGEYLDLLLEEINAEPKKSVSDQEKVFPWKEAKTAQDHRVEWSKDKYFPKSEESEMAEESEDESKKSSAQKHQEKRDARREKTNPNRSQDEERAERQRKSNQSKKSGNRCRDPSEPGCGDDDHPRSREATRKNNCERKGTQCEYHRVSPNHEPNSNRRSRDFDCIESCEDDAYDDYDDDVYADEVATACKRRECTGTKWSFNGAATYGEYLDLLLEEINAGPKESVTAQE